MRAVVASLLLAGTLVAVFWAGVDAGARSERALRARATEPLENAPSELEAALAISDAGARASALAAVLRSWGPGDVDAAFRVLGTTNLPVDGLALVILTDWAASFDPRDAFAHAAASQHPASYAAACAAIRRWARQDPAEALRAVEDVHDPQGIDPLLEALVLGWEERAGSEAPWGFVRDMPMGPSRQKLIQALLGRKMAVEGVEATLRFVESIPDDAVRRFKLQVFRRTARALARQDPERAVLWARLHSRGPHGDGLLRKVGTARVAHEGAAGFRWLRGMEAGPQRDEAVRETYRRWLMHDRATAMRWLRDAPHDPAFEPALVLLVGATAHKDIPAALALVPRLEDPGLREHALLRLGRVWFERDPDGAEQWIQNSGLSEGRQADLLARGSAGRELPSRRPKHRQREGSRELVDRSP